MLTLCRVVYNGTRRCAGQCHADCGYAQFRLAARSARAFGFAVRVCCLGALGHAGPHTSAFGFAVRVRLGNCIPQLRRGALCSLRRRNSSFPAVQWMRWGADAPWKQGNAIFSVHRTELYTTKQGTVREGKLLFLHCTVIPRKAGAGRNFHIAAIRRRMR